MLMPRLAILNVPIVELGMGPKKFQLPVLGVNLVACPHALVTTFLAGVDCVCGRIMKLIWF